MCLSVVVTVAEPRSLQSESSLTAYYIAAVALACSFSLHIYYVTLLFKCESLGSRKKGAGETFFIKGMKILKHKIKDYPFPLYDYIFNGKH